ncbi:MAG: N-6 DNA methylase [Blastocatellia bacterium]
MTDYIKRLTELRRHEQEARNYAPSSRWYVGLSHSIQHLALADTATNPKDRFLNAWNAIYNLTMIMHSRGDAEYRTLARWIEEIQSAPQVRKLAAATPVDFLSAIQKAERALLWNAETKNWREARTLVEAWLQKKESLSPEKACRYVFLVARDLRNAVHHATFSPNSTNVKKALSLAADHIIPLAEAAIRATIEHPPAGTTGRATAYRSFLYPFLKNSDSFFSDYYLERLFADAELKDFDEDGAKQSLRELYKSFNRLNRDLLNADAVETGKLWCDAVLFPTLTMAAHRGVRIVAEGGVFDPDYVLARADLKGKPRKEYQGKDAGRDLACLIWALDWSSNMDAVIEDPNFGALPLMEIANRALAQSNVAWAVITNGQRLRLLYKGTVHKLRSFLEIDLAAIIDRRVDNDAVLAFRYLLGLFSGSSFIEKDAADNTRLDRALKESERHGREIGDELKENVFRALEELGSGFLDYLHANPVEMQAWRHGRAPQLSARAFSQSEELLTDVYHESLSLMYRLLFLFYAESRDLLPMENELYRETYSLESVRDEIISTHDDPDPRQFFSAGNYTLWERLKELFGLVNKGWRNVIPAYNGGLFDPEEHEFLEHIRIGDNRLAQAIDLLSRARVGRAKGEGRKKVTYRDLDVRHLGSIYEGILEYAARIAEEDRVSIRRDKYEEYTLVSELDKAEQEQLRVWREAKDENPDNPQLPRSCKITDLKEKGQYFLVYGGRESKRKSSGSYYTPDYIVQYIVESTLGPLVRGENREGELKDVPLTADEILELKVLDPAMGSGHFLVAATEYLARAYGEALLREGRDQDGVVSEEESIRYKRMVAERCIYGVDINQMAVELAKLSLWLFTMDRGRPLSFLNHHLKYGNALIGAWIEDLGEPPEFDSKGKLKKRARSLNRNLFETRFRERVPLMLREIFAIINQETLSYKDIEIKKTLDKNVESRKQPFRNLADIYIGTYFGEEAQDYHNLLLNVEDARNRRSAVALEHQAFHWELEFPEVFFDITGSYLDKGGFDAVFGNPPYFTIQSEADSIKTLYSALFSEIYTGQSDILYFFIANGCRLMKQQGKTCMITSRYYLDSKHAGPFREWLARSNGLERLVDFQNAQLFEKVNTLVVISTFSQKKLKGKTKILFLSEEADSLKDELLRIVRTPSTFDIESKYFTLFECDAPPLGKTPWKFHQPQANAIIGKLQAVSETVFGSLIRSGQGIKTGLNDAFIISQESVDQFSIEQEILRPYVKTRDIQKYDIAYRNLFMIFLTTDDMINDFPGAKRWLEQYKKQLEERYQFKDGVCDWYSLSIPQSRELFEQTEPRLLVPLYSTSNKFGIDQHKRTYGYFTATDTYVISRLRQDAPSVYCIAAILNSSVMNYWHHNEGKLKRDGYYEYTGAVIQNYPLPYSRLKMDIFEDSKQILDELPVQMKKDCTYEHILDHLVRLRMSNKVSSHLIDEAINSIVESLYNLTKKETGIVRGHATD